MYVSGVTLALIWLTDLAQCCSVLINVLRKVSYLQQYFYTSATQHSTPSMCLHSTQHAVNVPAQQSTPSMCQHSTARRQCASTAQHAVNVPALASSTTMVLNY
jgi:hypothetical protein